MIDIISYRFAGRGGIPPGTGSEASGLEGLGLADIPVLIIEDEGLIAWSLESLLEELGFQKLVLAPSGEQAIASAQTAAPGLIISDINLGAGLDGVAAVAKIVQATAIPVIFVSGYANDEARSQITREIPGATILSKPVQQAQLRGAVIAALQPRSHH